MGGAGAVPGFGPGGVRGGQYYAVAKAAKYGSRNELELNA